MAAIIVFVYGLACLLGTPPKERPDILNLVDVGGGYRIYKLHTRGLIADNKAWIVPVKSVEWAYLSSRVLTIIVSEFGYIQPFNPIILSVIDIIA